MLIVTKDSLILHLPMRRDFTSVPAIFTATGNLISAIAGLAVAIVLAYQRKSLIVVAVGACAAVFIIEGIITLI